jgi:glycosyltransferase involved in cell wall biosynthesis
MKVLFLLLHLPDQMSSGGMYTDLVGQFVEHGHQVTVMAPDNQHKSTSLNEEGNLRILRVNSKQTQGVKNLFIKGIALATMSYFYKKAFKRYLSGETFDWIVMPTPPITLIDFVSVLKQQTQAKFYLILRDIHPQSVASIGLLRFRWQYNYLEKRARKGYQIADLIGCMSQGNIDFIASHYPQLERKKLLILYNWLKQVPIQTSSENIRLKYDLQGKFIALFGGTIGKGQRIENLVDLAEHYISNEQIVFLVIGKGVEKDRLQRIAEERHLTNLRFINYMPQADYLNFVKNVDLGLITINENYRVPTCPSKAVAYMSLGVPILAMINPNSDYGQWIEDAGAGYWAVGSDKEKIYHSFDRIYSDEALRKKMGQSGLDFFNTNLSLEVIYNTILSQMNQISK